MLSVPDLFARLVRRARAARGVSWAALAWAATAALTFAGLVAATLWAPASAATARTLLLGLPPGAAAVGYALGRRPRPPLAELLLAVDQRLGLEARLSSLYELTHRPAPAAFAARISEDVARRAPKWRKGVPQSRGALPCALGGAALVALGLTLVPLVAATPAERPAVSEVGAPAAPASVAEADRASRPQEGSSPDEGAALSPPGTPLPVRSGALRDILAELRTSSGAPRTSSASGPESEGQVSEWRRDLERLSERLERDSSPLGVSEEETLRNYVAATAPERQKAVDDAVATSDLDALRQTIRQLLAEPVPNETGDASTTSHLAPDATPPTEPETPATASTPAAPATVDPERPGAGTLGDGAEPQASPGDQAPPPVFDASETGVIPVSPPSVLGASGEYSEFLTLGVPVETSSAEGGLRDEATFSFERMESVLSGRSIPDGAVDAVRTYFERITEENP
jgi:hypothetical protein